MTKKKNSNIDAEIGDVKNSAVAVGNRNIVGNKMDGDLVGRDKIINIQQTASAPLNALHQVPPPPADFIGRTDELQELLAAIKQGGVTISGLQGLGGIGKTALALKLVEQLKPSYPDAQFYLDLKGASNQPLTVNEALAHVVRAYHPAAKLPDGQTELRALYLSVLDGQHAILLMDNAADGEQVEPLIPPTGCVLLVTSRWHFTLPGFAAKDLDTLTAADASALLLTIAPRIGASADEIAKLCGYLPLALRLAAGALAKYRNLKPVDYARRLQDTQQRLQLIEASLSLSYELLNDELRQRWRWLAVFPDSFADDAAAAVWEVAIDQTQQTLGELIAASMVEWNEITGRYRLHDLVWLFADAKLTGVERTEGLKRHATYYKHVLTVADNLYLQGGEALVRGLALFDLEWSNIQAGNSWVAVGIDGNEDMARLGMGYTEVGVYIPSLRQHRRDRIHWLEIALAAAKRVNERAVEGRTLGNLAPIYAAIGDTESAVQSFEQALLIFRELGDRRGEGNVLNNMGVACSDLGKTRLAIEVFELYLTLARELGDRRGESIALGNLGVDYKALGETQRAIQFLEQTLLLARELGDRVIEGHTLCNLGAAYADLNDPQRAIQFYEQTLPLARELGDRRIEGTVLLNMSLELDQIGKRAQAIQHAKQSLTIFEQIEDPNAAQVREQLDAWREESGQD